MGEEMSGYTLYGWPSTGSMVIEAAFAEAGVAYDLIPVDRKADANLTEDFRAINPRQQLPALGLPDGSVMTETAAMLLHIADAFPGAGLAPAPGSFARAQHDRWLTFCHANVYEGILRMYYPAKYVADPAAIPAVQTAAVAYVQRHFQIVEAALGAGPYLLGARLSMADLYVWMLAQWVDTDWLAGACPKTSALCAAVGGRAAIGPVQARNPA